MFYRLYKIAGQKISLILIIIILPLFCGLLIMPDIAYGFGLGDVYRNLHVNNTSPGNYQDAAAGYYSGGSSVIRTKNTSLNPLAITPPHLRTDCSGIDAYMGSFSMISGEELVTMANNIGSQALVYGFHLGMKTYAPQIEQILKDIRNLSMQLSQFGIGHCNTVRAGFAAALPQNSAMYETVCNEMSGGDAVDLGGQRKKCKSWQAQKEAIRAKQERDPQVMMDNYNIFIKVARAVGIPQELHVPLMSMVGTIVVRDGVVLPYPSLADNPESWNIHINGGANASMYSCNNADCLTVGINNNVNITPEASYAGRAKAQVEELRNKIMAQTTELTEEEKGFLDSLGQAFPIFDHITLEASSGISVIDADSQLIARYMLMSHLSRITSDIQNGVIAVKARQYNEKLLKDYTPSLTKLLVFARGEWGLIMSDADRINERAEKIEKHIMARERS